jgi:hypothetical protein
MEIDNTIKYRDEFLRILNTTIFSYPFDEKTDVELVNDAINRGTILSAFALYKIKNHEIINVPVSGNLKEIKYLTLKSLVENKEDARIEIKLSSFIYPSTPLSMFLKENALSYYSTFDNQKINDYAQLYKKIEKHIDCVVLVTTYNHTIAKFGGMECVNIIPIENEKDIADIIRINLRKERIKFIEDLFEMRFNYFRFSPVDKTLAKNILTEFSAILSAEYDKLV